MPKILSALGLLVLGIGVLGGLASCGIPTTPVGPGASKAVFHQPELSPAEIALLDDGDDGTSASYFQTTSKDLLAEAAGEDNTSFYDLGKLLVKDGLSSTIINLGREMNGTWYEWSEDRATPSEPDAYARAWQQVVTTMRSVPGQHFKFLWTLSPGTGPAAEAWPGTAYVDYIGTDVFDWYGGADGTYPHTKSGALNHEAKWQQILGAIPGGLNWMAAFSQATGKPVVIPEWGLDFHPFGGHDDPLFIANVMAWMKANNAIGLYWAEQHVNPAPTVSGPLLANQGAADQQDTPQVVNAMGNLLGGRLQYAGVYLADTLWPSDSADQKVLAPWEHAGYRLILSVPMVPNAPGIRSYSGPQEPNNKPYMIADYPDALAALREGL